MCPHCGADLTVWPPATGEQPQEIGPRLKTGSVNGDIFTGIFDCGFSCLLCGIGYVGIPLHYYTVRHRFPIYARSLGWTYIVFLMLGLGAFASCRGYI
jgi:hypothetical protein